MSKTYTKSIPDVVREKIEEYQKLKINGKEVTTPYYRNVKRIRGGLRVLVGKGTPEELENEVRIYGKLRDFELEGKSAKEIRAFMEKQGLGIDCSGFVVHLLDHWLHTSTGQTLYKKVKLERRRFLYILKYAQNINANTITNKANTQDVNVSDVKPGDLIRLRGGERGMHVLMVTDVAHNGATDEPTRIKYVHSAEKYKQENGIKYGEIRITDTNKGLDDQDWLEEDENGRNWSYQGFLREVEDNGLRRVNFRDELNG